MQLLEVLSARCFPTRCAGCGDPARTVCDSCHATMSPAPVLATPVGIDAWCSPFSYEGIARNLIARAKYRDHRYVLRWLALAMARCAADSADLVVHADALCWIPTTAARRRARGFDQAELLARALASGGVAAMPAPRPMLRATPFDNDDRLSVRQNALKSQTGRTAADRRARAHFTATRRCDGLTIIVVDDVTTTGATLTAAAEALRSAGAAKVLAITAARTAPPSGR